MKIRVLLIIMLLQSSLLLAQCPEVLNCSSDTLKTCYNNSNMPGLWSGQVFWDDLRKSSDLVEGMATISLRLKDDCATPQLASRLACHLFMDLNSDQLVDFFIYTDSVQTPGKLWANLQGAYQQVSFDTRALADSLKYFFVLDTVRVQNTLEAQVRFSNLSGIREEPYWPDAGPIRALWLLKTASGYDTLCQQHFRMNDCQKPQLSCKPWMVMNLDDPALNGTQGIYDPWDFITTYSDNATPEVLIKQRVEWHYESTGNFSDAGYFVEFTCDSYYYDSVFIISWVRDLSGNTAKCSTLVMLYSNCPAAFKLCAYTEQGKGVTGWYLRPEGSPGAANFTSFLAYTPPDKPCFSTPIFWINQFWQNIQLTPYDTVNYIKGVSTFDLVLISKHILGIDPLNSPYKMIAADANRSGTITTLDIVELRKLILGVSTKLPQNDSWRFIPKDYVFPNVQNPFASVFPEKLEFIGTGWAPLIFKTFQFVAVKIGDINLSAIPLQHEFPEARTLYDSLSLMMPRAQSGELVPVYFEKARLEGFQWSLQNVEPELIVPGQGLAEEHFAWSAEQRTLRCSWISPDASAQDFDAARPLCWLKLKQDATGLAPDFVSEAYEAGAVQRAIRLESVPTQVGKAEAVVVAPNPTSGSAWVQGRLQQAGAWNFQVLDAQGKLLWTGKGFSDDGAFELQIPAVAMETAGVYFWVFSAGGTTSSGKLLRN